MFVEAPLAGTAEVVKEHLDDGAEIEALRVRIPVCFRNVSAVDEGLISCEVEGLLVFATGEPLRMVRAPSICPHAGGAITPPIVDRPIQFRPDGQDTNILDLELVVARSIGNIRDLDTRDIGITLALVFKSLHRLQFLADVEAQLDPGSLLVRSFKRSAKPGPLLWNLLILLGLLVGLSWWNYGINSGVEGQPSWWQQNAISVAIGFVLAFFGLTFSRIKSWLKTAANVRGLVNFPELHVDTTVARLLGARGVSLALLAATLGVSYLAVANWSHSLPPLEDERIAWYHIDNKNWIEPGRKVYRRDAKDNDIALVCKTGGTLVPSLERVLAFAEPSGLADLTIRERNFQIVAPSAWAPNLLEELLFVGTNIEIPVTGAGVLSSGIETGAEAITAYFCGGQIESDRFHVTVDYGNTDEGDELQVLSLGPSNPLRAEDVWAQAENFRTQILKGLTPKDLWLQRSELAEELQNQMIGRSTRRLGNQDLANLLARFMEEIDGGNQPSREKALERLIEVKAVVGFLRERALDPSERTVTLVVDPIAERFSGLSWADSDWRVFTATVEVLLEAEALFPDAGGPSVATGIEAILPSVHAEPVYHYIASCLRHPKSSVLLNLDLRKSFLADHLRRVEQQVSEAQAIDNILRLVYPTKSEQNSRRRDLQELFNRIKAVQLGPEAGRVGAREPRSR